MDCKYDKGYSAKIAFAMQFMRNQFTSMFLLWAHYNCSSRNTEKIKFATYQKHLNNVQIPGTSMADNMNNDKRKTFL